MQIYIRQNLLQGLGTGVNGRFISVAQKNIQAAQEAFRSQLLNVVANVLNLYWDLVTDDDDLAVRQRAVDQAQKFYDDTQQADRARRHSQIRSVAGSVWRHAIAGNCSPSRKPQRNSKRIC